ncbi:hypothetical protein M427DRAFT_62646 [Gonapodya prolifera JEL478]|uniref:Uncharacterized protein n=1 Tax=Gonapodya prolifera (strain JEL478) TaxID=1344416 RepID=A0A139A0U9_GONPJ|nr:hypothetical protein M427DRAFT_62646 [Gonapodya prolifera JEL478]|eukprot:KXS10248.1 hypothetical protein M427DRAFT_62646 [Gonapodya prolifera JEL478]
MNLTAHRRLSPSSPGPPPSNTSPILTTRHPIWVLRLSDARPRLESTPNAAWGMDNPRRRSAAPDGLALLQKRSDKGRTIGIN